MTNDLLTGDLLCIDLKVCEMVVLGGRAGWMRAGVGSDPTLVGVLFPTTFTIGSIQN